MSWRRKLAQASGATLGFISGDLPGAVAGADLAGRMYDNSYPESAQMATKRKSNTQRNRPRRTKRPRVVNPPKRKVKGGKRQSSLVSPFQKVAKTRKVRDIGVKNFKSGVSITFDTGNVVSANTCVYLLHNNMPYDAIRYITVASWLKKVFLKAGLQVVAFSDKIFSSQADYAYLLFSYRTSATGQFTQGTPIACADVTFQNLVSSINAQFYMNASFTESWQPISLKLYQKVGDNDKLTLAEVILNGAKVKISGDSKLKIQNRSYTSLGNDTTEDLDRMPVDYVIYKGKGDGFVPKSRYALPNLLCKGSTGENAYTYPFVDPNYPNDTGADLTEPMSGKFFTNCSKQGIGKLSPGNMMTSSIKTSQIFELTYLSDVIGTSANVLKKRLLGQVKMYAFDKTLHMTPGTHGLIENSLKVAYEHQIFLSAVLLEPDTTQTRPFAYNIQNA